MHQARISKLGISRGLSVSSRKAFFLYEQLSVPNYFLDFPFELGHLSAEQRCANLCHDSVIMLKEQYPLTRQVQWKNYP